MRYITAILCALAIGAAQSLYGGFMRPVFALPAFILVGLAGILSLSALFSRNFAAPSLGCIGSVTVLAGWLLWREVESPDPWLAAGYFRLTLACFTVYLLFACFITNPLHRLTFVGLLFVMAVIQAAYGAWQFAHRHDSMPIPWLSEYLKVSYQARLNGRAHGFYLNANHLAWFLNAVGIFALATALWGRWGIKTKIIVFYVALMSLVVSLITLSRGGLLALASGLGVFFVLSAYILLIGARGRRFVAFLVAAVGLVATISIAIYTFSTSFSVQARFSELLSDGSRPLLFNAVTRQFQLDPFLGTGAGTFLYYGRQFRELVSFSDDIFAHNDWMQLAADFGFPALAILVLVVLMHVGVGLRNFSDTLRRRMSHNSRPQSHAAALLLAALATLIVFMVHSFFDFNMQLPSNALLAAACLGMVANGGLEKDGKGMRWVKILSKCVYSLSTSAVAVLLLIVSFRAAPAEVAWLKAENAFYQGDWEAAESFAQDGLRETPSHPKLHRIVGDCSMALAASGDRRQSRWDSYRSAVKAYGTAVQLAPLDFENRLLLAEALTKIGRYHEAGLEAQIGIRQNPIQGYGYSVYAAALAESGRLEELEEAERLYLDFKSLPRGISRDSEIEELRERIRDKRGD